MRLNIMGVSLPPGPTSTSWVNIAIGRGCCTARQPVMKLGVGHKSTIGLTIACFLDARQTILPTEFLPLSHLQTISPQEPTSYSLTEAANGGRLRESGRLRG